MKKLSIILALLIAFILCAPALAADQIKVCQVTDLGGVDDKSFNATAWAGILLAEKELGIKGSVLESKSDADYAVNIDQFVDENCDLIVTVGFMLADATVEAADTYPDKHFTIIDMSLSKGNVVDQVFQTDEAAFLAGYLAAGMTKTGKIGTFGGMCIPTVTIFMDGYARGAAYYNEVHGTKVEVLGWDVADPKKGLCVDSFDDLDKGKQVSLTMMDQGADIIMPVAGPVGGGTIAAIEDRKSGMLIGVDADWALTHPGNDDIILTSVVKKMDITTLEVVKTVVDGTFKGGKVVGTLENTGVDLAPYHKFESKVPAELVKEVEALRAKIIAGEIKLSEAYKQ